MKTSDPLNEFQNDVLLFIVAPACALMSVVEIILYLFR